MILRQGDVPPDPKQRASFESLRVSDAGGLTQFGAYVQTLQPGQRTSNRHWHEREDEFLYMLSGEATVVEDDGEHLLHAGDAACWPGGSPNAHQVLNKSGAPCSFLVVGTRLPSDTVRYPDLGRVLTYGDGRWQLRNAADGSLIKEGLEE